MLYRLHATLRHFENLVKEILEEKKGTFDISIEKYTRGPFFPERAACRSTHKHTQLHAQTSFTSENLWGYFANKISICMKKLCTHSALTQEYPKLKIDTTISGVVETGSY